MSTVPPPSQYDAELSARLDRLARRRPPVASSGPPIAADPALAARLARLAGPTRQAGSTAPRSPSTGPSRGKRRHAAQNSRVAALALSLAATGGLTTVFGLLDGPGTSVVTEAGGVVTSASATAQTAAVVPSSTQPRAAGAATTSGSQALSARPASTVPMVVAGDVYTNRWGPVQVQVTFAADGTLTSVDAVQTPYRDGQSVRINDRAVPVLNSEALAVQSGNVDTVSGATYTSVDYRRSLQSAIDAARSAGITQLA